MANGERDRRRGRDSKDGHQQKSCYPALGPPTEAGRNPSFLPPPFCSIISARVMAGVDTGSRSRRAHQRKEVGGHEQQSPASLTCWTSSGGKTRRRVDFPRHKTPFVPAFFSYLQCTLLHLDPDHGGSLILEITRLPPCPDLHARKRRRSSERRR